MRNARGLLAAAVAMVGVAGVARAGLTGSWNSYGGNSEHTAAAPAAADALQTIAWHTHVDLNQHLVGGDLFTHYGSPVITSVNTIVVPVKTGSDGGFKLNAYNAGTAVNPNASTDPATLWTLASDYILPAHGWVPSFSPTLTPTSQIYYPGAGGSVFLKSDANSASLTTSRLAFYGTYPSDSTQQAFINSHVFIDTPITSDSSGNVYFGYKVVGDGTGNATTITLPGGGTLSSGIARIDGTTHVGTSVSVATATNNDDAGTGASQVVYNCAPAIGANGKLYVAMSSGGEIGGHGYLVSLNATTLAPVSHVALVDPKHPLTSDSSHFANLPDDGTASPTIGPDGDVYFGVLDHVPENNDRGYLLHFSSDLATQKTTGAFGWDDTVTVVPRSMLRTADLHGSTSSYFLMTKYNNYAGGGLTGDGVNKIAIIDPNDLTALDGPSGLTLMDPVLQIAGVTPDAEQIAGHPNAVREWCINNAVVDPLTDSILVNSEDGWLYRWDLSRPGSFTQRINLNPPIGEAYTPTLVGPDGTVYAINDSVLYAIVPEPGTLGLVGFGGVMLGLRRRRKGRALGSV